MDENTPLSVSDFTPEFCHDLITQYGCPTYAAKAIAYRCISERYHRPASWLTVKKWIRAGCNSGKVGLELAEAPQNSNEINRIAELLRKAGIDANNVGGFRGAKLKAWGYAMKGPDGNPIEGGLHATEVSLDPIGPKWPVVQPAPLGIVFYTAPAPVASSLQQVLILGDMQVGYYRDIRSMALTPFHDLAAMDLTLQVAASRRWNRIVILGDALDMQSFSRYLQVAEFQLTMQPSIDFLDHYLKLLRSAIGPDCEIDFLEGNHSRRISEYIAVNARAAYGLRRGGNPEWPQLSIPALLNFDIYKIRYSAAYPGGQVWLTPQLVCQHQNPAKTDLRASVIHGHQERRSLESRTIHYFQGIETYETWCVPGVGRVDDVADPTALNRTSVPSDRTRKNGTQGIAAVAIAADGRFNVTPIPISKGYAQFADREFHGISIDFGPMPPRPDQSDAT